MSYKTSHSLRFKLSCYQLNRTALHSSDPHSSTPEEVEKGNNVCWHEREFSLWDEEKNEVNLDGLKKIIKFYIMEPTREIEVLLFNVPFAVGTFLKIDICNSHSVSA